MIEPDGDQRITNHLEELLGAWPPTAKLQVVGSAQRTKPGWDEAIRPVLGIETLQGTVLSVPPRLGDTIRGLAAEANNDLDLVGAQLSTLLERPGWRFGRGFYRWTTRPTPGEDRGHWLDASDQRLPTWLRRFSGPVLVALVDDEVVCAVGIKRHNHWGHELAVRTDPSHRRTGLGAALVAQAGRQVLEHGAIPIYVHADDNVGSACTAQAAGFDDIGWRVAGIFPPSDRDAK